MNLYIGNLSYEVTEAELLSIFKSYGKVTAARVIMDPETGRSKGFGFVDITPDEGGKRAMEELQGREVLGRAITINEARPKAERPRPRPFRGDPDKRRRG